MARPIAPIKRHVPEIDIIRPKVLAAKRCVSWQRPPVRPGAGEARVQRRRDDQHAREHVVVVSAVVGLGLQHGHAVLRRGLGMGGLAEEVERAGACDVELFGVVAG